MTVFKEVTIISKKVIMETKKAAMVFKEILIQSNHLKMFKFQICLLMVFLGNKLILLKLNGKKKPKLLKIL